jgi:hypothetical protein
MLGIKYLVMIHKMPVGDDTIIPVLNHCSDQHGSCDNCQRVTTCQHLYDIRELNAKYEIQKEDLGCVGVKLCRLKGLLNVAQTATKAAWYEKSS